MIIPQISLIHCLSSTHKSTHWNIIYKYYILNTIRALLTANCSNNLREPFQSICVIFGAFFQCMSTLPEKFQIMSTYADWTSVCRHCLKKSAYVDIRGFHRLTVTYIHCRLYHFLDFLPRYLLRRVMSVQSFTCFAESLDLNK